MVLNFMKEIIFTISSQKNIVLTNDRVGFFLKVVCCAARVSANLILVGRICSRERVEI